jgi:hypothetical protein
MSCRLQSLHMPASSSKLRPLCLQPGSNIRTSRSPARTAALAINWDSAQAVIGFPSTRGFSVAQSSFLRASSPRSFSAPISHRTAYLCTPQRTFSSTSTRMTATKIDGTAIAKEIRERIHKDIEDAQKSNPRFKPSLKIIQGGLICSNAIFDFC